MSYERMTCRLCGGPVHKVLGLKPTPIANSFPEKPNEGDLYPLALKQCEACGHVQISHVIDDSVLYGTHYKYSTPDALKPYCNERAAILRKTYPEARNVVEIGANNGLFLHALHDAGFKQVVGVDPAGQDPLVWNMAFNVKTAGLILKRIGAIDLIVANNVFAHIDDLDSVFDGIDEILSLDGTLVFEVQYLPAMMARGAFDMIYHEHRDYHTLSPLLAFLRKHSLVMNAYDIFPMHGGSLRVYVSRKGKEVAFYPERLDWKGFSQSIQRIKNSIRVAVDRKVVAFGATAKACTLIHNCGIADRIEYVADNTLAKQGRYIPGTAIEIRPEEELAKDDFPLFLTAWNYADYIHAKYPNRVLIVPFAVQERLAA